MIIFLYSISISLMILLPVTAAVVWRRRYPVRWALFGVGMLTFVGSQVYHLPFNNWLTDLGVIGPIGPDAPRLLATSLVLGFSAGLSESIARAVGYWLLFRWRKAEKWADSVMVGLGHGGIEAMLLVGVNTAAAVTSLWALQGQDLAAAGIPAEQIPLVAQQMERFLGAPHLAFVPLAERLLAMTFHVLGSVLVWQAFKRRNPLYFVTAVLYHAAFDTTAVYASQFISNPWLLEGLFALILLPGVVYLWRSGVGQRDESYRVRPLRDEVALFGTAVHKELVQQWRTKRVIVVGAVFLLFGLGSPLLAKFTPQMLTMVEGAEQFADLIPTPTTADSLAQYIKNLTQFGFMMAILLGMGAVAGEKERGTAALILSKPLPRWAFLLSKFTAQALVFLGGFVLAALGALYYTGILFEPFQTGPFLLGNGLLWLWLLLFTAVTLLGSTIGNSTGAAAGIGLVGAVLLLLAGSLPYVGPLMPSGLLAWASQLGLDVAIQANGGAVAAAVVLIVVMLVTAVALFETQEL
ncbi:MAG: YhfC family intramembrane metalloprotease [Ardenticatenaceae bacterium]|nr:YhfC family intramembrane metalloprotease [Ardenticatenaceae bacterium]MCB9444986.1 YhfC family intramembrane metalloprotease [Ardenticatenaceae bacterium]